MEWIDSLEAEWRDAVTRWESAAADFMNAYNILIASRSMAEALGPEELARWTDHYNYAQTLVNAVQSLQSAMGSASDWFRQTFGLSGVKRALNGMGSIGLVPVAVIVGSIAALGTGSYALYSYNAELKRKWDYIQGQKNITPEQVQGVLNSGAPVPLLSDVKSMAIWIVIGGVLFFFGPGLIKSLKGGKQ